MPDIETVKKLVASVGWHHDWEIVPGVRTHGAYNPAPMLEALNLPADMTGKSVADVGASNGYFSFSLRSRGARVAAFDYRHEDNSGFGLARHILGVNDIPHHHLNVTSLDAARHGTFDVVLALGLLYHTADPFTALSRLAALASDKLFVESYCDPALPGMSARFIPDVERFPGKGQPNRDRSNFWCFSPECLKATLEDVGFAPLSVIQKGDRVLIDARRIGCDARAPLAFGVMGREQAGENKDDPASWKIF